MIAQITLGRFLATAFRALPCGMPLSRHPGEPGARKRQRPDVADLVDEDQRAWVLRVEPVDGVFPVRNRLACQKLALASDHALPVRRLPDVEPDDDSRPGGWCHGGIPQSVGRSEALPSTRTLPGRGPRAWQFPISRSERRASSVATPPPGPRGAGAHGHPGTPDRRPLGAWTYCRPCAECSPPKFIDGLSQTVMGRVSGAADSGGFRGTSQHPPVDST